MRLTVSVVRNVLRWVKREPSAVLLLVQLLSVLAFPFLEETHAGRAVFSALAILVLTLAVRGCPRAVVHAVSGRIRHPDASMAVVRDQSRGGLRGRRLAVQGLAPGR